MENSEKRMQPLPKQHHKVDESRADLESARANLAEAEAALAKEQAAVNAFRMHCRLKLDNLVEEFLELRSEKETLLVELELRRQGIDPAFLEGDDPLDSGDWAADPIAEEEPLLPTETPRDKAAEKRLFRELARRFHPDLAASVFERSYRTTIMAAINDAYAAGNTEALYDLAGELPPDEATELSQISDVQERQTRQAINKMRRLENKAKRQLQALRKENTARLWQRAQTLEDQDEDGWSTIRRELEVAIDRRREEILNLRRQVQNIGEDEKKE